MRSKHQLLPIPSWLLPVIDKTKHWEIGIGASKDGVVGMIVGFTIKNNVGGWILGRQGYVLAVIMVKI